MRGYADASAQQLSKHSLSCLRLADSLGYTSQSVSWPLSGALRLLLLTMLLRLRLPHTHTRRHTEQCVSLLFLQRVQVLGSAVSN